MIMDTKTAFFIKAGLAALGVIGTVVLVAMGKAPIESVQSIVQWATVALIGGTALMQGAASMSSAIRATAAPSTTVTAAVVGGGEQITSVTKTEATVTK
jgi:hypothetical protein